MHWTAPVDGYCERLGPGLWAEPLNAVTNLAFLGVALWLWPRVRGDRVARALCLVLMAIGAGSGLFHTFATRWAGLADVLPILGFVLIFQWAVNARVLGWSRWAALAATALFFPYAALATTGLARAVPGLGGSAAYGSVALLIALYALALVRSRPRFARDLGVGAGLLALSITARALDMPLCSAWPYGTHFAWHLLNAALLGWMIAALHRAALAAPPSRG